MLGSLVSFLVPPHLTLLLLSPANAGEEVLADFGYDWFNRVQDASHRALARELLDYRIGAKTGGFQVRVFLVRN